MEDAPVSVRKHPISPIVVVMVMVVAAAMVVVVLAPVMMVMTAPVVVVMVAAMCADGLNTARAHHERERADRQHSLHVHAVFLSLPYTNAR